MSEINIPKENEGFIYTILSFERNVEIKCNKNCRYIKDKKYYQDCPAQLAMGNGKTKSKFTADKLVLNIKTSEGIRIGHSPLMKFYWWMERVLSMRASLCAMKIYP